MDWNEIFKLIGITSGPQIILIIIIGFWGKKLIEYFFAKTIEIKKTELTQNLENYKQKIEHENKSLQLDLDKNLEIYKNKLEILRLEFQVQFAELHVKRSEIIVKLYGHLTELNSAMLDLTARIHPVIEDAEKEEKQRIQRVNKSFFDFSNYYIQNKIFFPKSTTEKLDKIQKFTYDKAWDFTYLNNRLKSGQMIESSWKTFYKESQTISEEVKKEIPTALEDLENEFRDLLGVNRHNTIKQID